MQLKHVVPALLWAALIFYLSSLPSTSVPSLGIESEDLAAHFAVYAVLGYLLALAVMRTPDNASAKLLWLTVAIGMLYGASDEIHQMFVAGRCSTVSDFIADALGTAAGTAIFARFPKLFERLDRWVFRTRC